MNFQDQIVASLIPRTAFEKEGAFECFKEMVKARVTPAYFTGNHKTLLEFLSEHVNKEPMFDSDILEAYLGREERTPEQNSEIRILFSMLKGQYVDLDKLKAILPAFIRQYNEEQFGVSLKTSATILTDGLKIGNKELQGLQDAKSYLINKVSGLQGTGSEVFPQGNIDDLMERFWENYDFSEKNPGVGLLTSIPQLDALTKGARNGELWVIAASFGEGKSQLLRVFSYYASILQGKNVVLATLEMPMDDVLNQYVSLHSTHPKFNNPRGIKAIDIFNGTLTENEKIQLKEVTEDFKSNPAYGKLHIMQLPYQTTVSKLREQLIYLNSLQEIHGLYVDYSALIRPETNRQNFVVEMSQIINDLKLLAISFNEGEGIPIFLAHQVSREARQKAEKETPPRYTAGFCADSSTAERAADVLIWALRTEDMVQSNEVKIGITKFRRGPLISDMTMFARYSHSKVEPLVMQMGSPDLI